MIYLFDSSYQGYLTCVFEAFERKEWDIHPRKIDQPISDIFQQSRMLVSNEEKAKRILNGIESKLGKDGLNFFYCNFLMDEPNSWHLGVQLLIQLFKEGSINIRDFGNSKILQIHQNLKKVSRERHRMKAFIRFVKSNDGLYTALIEPDFNVLPLILNFFKNRFADQSWLIYDLKRNYGYHFQNKTLQEVRPSLSEEIQNPYDLELNLDPRELEFQHLWKTYFKSTNIKERKNLKLHLRHVPKRYWKYLVEKDVKAF